MIRLGMTLGIKEEKIEEYKKLHATTKFLDSSSEKSHQSTRR